MDLTEDELILRLANGDWATVQRIKETARTDEYIADVLEEYIAAAAALGRWWNKRKVGRNACQQYRKVMAERLEELHERLQNGAIMLDKGKWTGDAKQGKGNVR